jgi:hypothetical protein
MVLIISLDPSHALFCATAQHEPSESARPAALVGSNGMALLFAGQRSAYNGRQPCRSHEG